MAIGGKIIGGIFGSMLFGPLGAVLGVAIGHSFDNKKRYSEANDSGMYREEGMRNVNQNRQMTFFVAAFSLLGKLAAADGKVSECERDITERFITEELRFHPQDRDFALRIFDTAASSSESFERFAEQFADCFRGETQMLDLMMDILVRVACADGVLDAREEQFIAKVAMCLQYPAYNVTMLKNKYNQNREQGNRERDSGYGQNSGYQSAAGAGSLSGAYSVLGCSEQDSVDIIKTKYKKLIKEYHPDVIASKGLPEEFTEFANKKFAQIQEAYDRIRKNRGF